MDAPSKLAQLAEGRLQLAAGGLRQLTDALLIVLQELLDHAQAKSKRHQPLLRPIMEIPLEPAPLGEGCLDDAHARGAQLVDLGSQLGVKALVLECERSRRADRAHELGIVERHAAQL
jgi:hypothetical protein